MNEITKKSNDELVQRQTVLEGEIQSNELENRELQSELDRIYAEQDRRRDPLPRAPVDILADASA